MTADSRRVAHVGRYEMGAEIASGGMATVYLARMSGAAGFEKLVALKRVHPHLAGEPAFIDMFLDEARIASRIQHPNVCQVFDFGEAEGEYFIAMEFLVGETLAKVQRGIAGSPLLNDPRRTFVSVRLIADACEGLHAAHELRGRDGNLLNVVHRDVSPQNLFVGYDGNAKVVDFGIASASDRLHQTSTGTVKGKFAYMAPEQARGKRVDRRSDVFALGVVLWELLAFKRLFRRDTPAETLVALMSDEIPPPSQVSPLAPPELDAIVLRALERDPDARYATARDLSRDLLRAAGRIGDAVDRAEVAEWMDALFPEGRRRHAILLESARWGEAERTERSDPGAVSDVVSRSSWSGVRPEEILADAADVIEVDVPQSAPSHAPPPSQVTHAASQLTPHAVPVPPPRTSLLRWAGLAGAALVITTLTVVVLTQILDPSEDAEPSHAAQPTGTAIASVTDPPPEIAPAPPEVEPPPAQPVPALQGFVEAEVATGGEQPEGSSDESESDSDAVAAVEDSPRRGRRPRHPRRPPQPATGAGTVIVSTPGGWANVYDANGRFLGETPLTTSLPAGRHRLSLRPFGQPPSRNVTVEVTAGGTARVSQSL